MDASVVPSEAPLAPSGAGGLRAIDARAEPADARAAEARSAPEPTSERHIGRAAAWGALAGFLGLIPIVTGIGLLGGFDLVGSLGIGAFAGIWGGPGFGGMLGATLAYTRTEGRRHGGA